MQDKYYPVPQVLSLVVLFALYQAKHHQGKQNFGNLIKIAHQTSRTSYIQQFHITA